MNRGCHCTIWKKPGPGDIPPRVLKEIALPIKYPLKIIFHMSLGKKVTSYLEYIPDYTHI